MIFSQIFNENAPEYNNRGISNCIVLNKKINKDKKTLTFFVRTIKDPQDTGRNLVTIRPNLTLKTLQILSDKTNITLKDLPMKCFCTCKAFQYQGIAYNLTKMKSKIGAAENREPNIKDPERNHKACKHIAKVFQRFKDIPLKELYTSRGL